jgi:prophage regulatory protein
MESSGFHRRRKKSRSPASDAALCGVDSALTYERADPSTGGDKFNWICRPLRRSSNARVTMKNVDSHDKEQVTDGLPKAGFVRLVSILAPQGPIPVGRSTWWAGVKTGRFPKPVKLGARTTAWKVDDIRDLIEKAS